MPTERQRLDLLLVERGVFDTRSAAQAAIASGTVTVEGVVVTKSAAKTSIDAEIEAVPAHPYVSRGGIKLAHALDTFRVDSAGKYCLDIGASTGGFTDVLLQRDAAHVTCVDVGTGQLHPRIAASDRVTAYEGLDARSLTASHLDIAPDLIVCDASFIGLEKLLAEPLKLAALGAEFVGLFKPQFQVGRKNIGKGGIVSDAAAVETAAQNFETWLASKNWTVAAWADSPIRGGDGNAERLVHARQSETI